MDEGRNPSTSNSDSSSAAIDSSSCFESIFRRRATQRKGIKYRKVLVSHALSGSHSSKNHPHYGYANNRICTTKYSLLSFIPKNLFEQFHRFANLYFLGIVLLNWLPQINAFGKEISMIPVVFVLGVTAVKDAFEDYRRYLSDKRVNNLTCRVYSWEDGRYVKTLWQHVQVGDIVHLSCNEIIPADIVLLRSSDDQGLCFIETANLDGESNLKQRQVVRGYAAMRDIFHPTHFNSTIECDPPNNKIHQFSGYIIHHNKENVPVNKENLLLRDCVVKNTDFVEGIVVYAGYDTKAMLNNGGPRYKRSKLEKCMNRDIIWCIVILVVLCFAGATGSSLWLSSYEHRENISFIPFEHKYWFNPSVDGVIQFWTFVIILQVMIPISLYVTIELIKLGQVFHIHHDVELYDEHTNKRIECRALNIPEDLGQLQFVFSDKTGTLTENNMMFRRCTIGGVDYNHHTSNLADNTKLEAGDEWKGIEKHSKSNMTFNLNPQLQEELNKLEVQLFVEPNLYREISLSAESQRIKDFFLLMAVCNTVVVSKHPHKDQMTASGLCLSTTHLSRSSLSINVGVNTSDDGLSQQSQHARLIDTVEGTPPESGHFTPFQKPQYFSVSGSSRSTTTPTSTPVSSVFRPIYEAESPDEIALVDAAFHYNFRLLQRTPDCIVIALPGGLLEFKVLHVLPFDATRKRMSVLLEHPFTKEKILYCKGADSAVLPLLAPVNQPEIKEIITKTHHHVNNYSKKGLRILCMAKKVLSPEEYEQWLSLHTDAEMSLNDREQRVQDSASYIERNLELLGATGIEDCLQEGVPECIASLQAAGLVVWVLTGDKQETAVNIAYSCQLFTPDMEILTLNARSKVNINENSDTDTDNAVSNDNTHDIVHGDSDDDDGSQGGVADADHESVIGGDYDNHIPIWCPAYAKRLGPVIPPLSDDWDVYTGRDNNPVVPEQGLGHNVVMKLMGSNGYLDLGNYLYVDNFYSSPDLFETLKEQGTGVCGTVRLNRRGLLEEIRPARLQLKKGEDPVYYKKVTVTPPLCDQFQGLMLRCPELDYSTDCHFTGRSAGDACTPTSVQSYLGLASIVKLVKEKLNVMTLAIGDGANDVSMIQKADVGVGISGQEGLQAVMASDFAVTRFRHLERLLLVHGHWCYDRLARTVLYFFYKNASFIFVIFWYQLYCGFSGMVMIDQLYLMLFNVLFTALPPLVFGIYDQDCPADVLLQKPSLYSQGRHCSVYTKYSFWLNMLDALYQSVIILFVPVLSFYDSDLGMWEFGSTIFTACVLVQLAHLAVETRSWTSLQLLATLLSVAVYLGFAVLYNALCLGSSFLQNPYWVMQHVMATARYWFTVVLVLVISCLPRFVFYTFKNSLFPCNVMVALQENRYKQTCSVSTSCSQRSSDSSITTVRLTGSHEIAQEDHNSDIYSVSTTDIVLLDDSDIVVA
ncbi:probable phospholipid-transporting ATPase VA [Limulus polyphemus]|uniref:Phospholipid-transporting ATPase n=1 Tax=Limulus polyphemus TaxID=6850 RepID=A0ABM1S3G3_LIMPO|nr:probable phospholipid-transporting ATPase VA [Limulus polyphemus]